MPEGCIDQRFQLLRVLRAHIVRFGAVFIDVIELPTVLIEMTNAAARRPTILPNTRNPSIA
jgi:hypothetical protein